MDRDSISGSKKDWKYFLSSIKNIKTLPKNNLIIKFKSDIECLATTFANRLLKNVDDYTVEKVDSNPSKHLDVSENQTKTPEVPQPNINENANETSAHPADDTIQVVSQTDSKENVNEESAQRHDAYIQEVPQTDINEDVKETSSHPADVTVPKVSQTDSKENVNEESAQMHDAVIQEAPQTDINEDAKETSAHSADVTVPKVSQTDSKENVNEESAQIHDAVKQEASQTDINENANETSAHSASVTVPKVSQTDSKENVNEDARVTIEAKAENMPLVSGQIDRIRCRNKNAPSKKTDIDQPGSKWSVEKIAEYFIFSDCVEEIKIQTKDFHHMDDIYQTVQNDISCLLKTVKGIDLKAENGNSDSELLMQLKSIASTEAGSRLVLDALLVPLCSSLELQLEVEKTVDCTFLPNCRFDYCIRKGGHIIGCIEAKSVKGLSDRSVAQAVLQLMTLQTAVLAHETPKVDISEFPVFAIVTDGHRFIYMQLKGSVLGFEYEGHKLKIREVKQESDFKEILQHITFLVDGDQSGRVG